jgi:hypothetical protein
MPQCCAVSKLVLVRDVFVVVDDASAAAFAHLKLALKHALYTSLQTQTLTTIHDASQVASGHDHKDIEH